MTYVIKKAETDKEFADCVHVRAAVFLAEQGDTMGNEFDGFDDDATHFIAYGPEGQALATCRCRILENGTLGKLERVAVLLEGRGKGVAGKICQLAVDEMVQQGAIEAKTNAQSYVVSLYGKLGFEVYGDEFMEAGIPHRSMKMSLTKECAA